MRRSIPLAKTTIPYAKLWVAGLIAGGLLLSAHSLMIPAKAYLSVHLLNHAWAQTLRGDADARPWPWMDSTPVARIRFVGKHESFIVMRGISGQVMAFSPGWHEQTALPGTQGVSILSAHRDTHFRILKDLENGDIFELQTINGDWVRYQVQDRFITDKPQLPVPVGTQQSIIYLTTCYPFSDIGSRTQRRYVVAALRI